MSAQEAAAAATAVVASDRVPFATEYLIGDAPVPQPVADSAPMSIGAGAIVVPADSVDGFAAALQLLLSDAELRVRLGDAAYHITIPAFGWDRLGASFLDAVTGDRDG